MSLELSYRLDGGEWRGSHSFVRNWTLLLKGLWSATNTTLIDVGGVSRNLWPGDDHAPLSFLSGQAQANDDSKGIVVGSGDGSEDYEGHSLSSKILHAWPPEAGKLYYLEDGVTTETESGYCEVVKTRRFINYTAAPITVKEFGIYVRCIDTGGTSRYFMILREVLAAPLVIGTGKTEYPPDPGQTGRIDLTWRITV